MTESAVPSPRPPLLRQAAASGVTAAGLMLLAHAGTVPLVLGVGALQLLLALAFLALVEVPAAGGAFVIAVGTALAADVVVHVQHGRVGGLAGVAAVAFVAGLLHQLVRRHRSRVTEALADTMVLVLLVTAAACLPAVLHHEHGEALARAGLLAAGAALVVGRLLDAALPRPQVSEESTRGWAGLLLGLAAGVAVAAPEAGSAVSRHDALLVGLVCAATAVAFDLFADLVAAQLRGEHAIERRWGALRPTMALLPFAVLGPVLLVSAHLLERS